MPAEIKQRDLRSFFTPLGGSAHDKRSPVAPSRAQQSAQSTSVPGLSLLPAFIPRDMEHFLLAYLDAQPWRTDLSRRTMHFGGTYCLMPAPGSDPDAHPEVLTAPPIPPAFDDLMRLFVSAGIYPERDLPQYCIVNEYRAAQGISAHVENFTFGEPVCSLSLGDTCPMRFHELVRANDGSVRSGKARVAERTGRRVDVVLPGRSLVVLRGPARSEWQHEIPRTKKGRVGRSGVDGEWRRVSLTFRVKKEV